VTAYANAKAKVAKIKGAKKLDQTKLHEVRHTTAHDVAHTHHCTRTRTHAHAQAEKEEQDAKENFESSVDETAVAFKKLLGNDQKYLTEELCMGYLDAMEKYLIAGQEKVNELVDELNQIRPGLADAVRCVVLRVACRVACRVSCVVCRVSCVVCRVSCVVCRVSCVVCRVSCVVCRVVLTRGSAHRASRASRIR
jgi:hypothetical protein